MEIVKNKILVYMDKGCFDTSSLVLSLKNYFPNKSIETINSSEIISGKGLDSSVLALFIPGGKADCYFEKLGEIGNSNIRNYVINGGIYFGICAGAYYACKNVEFEPDIPESKISAKYKLDLINGTAFGSLYKDFGIDPCAHRPESSAIIKIKNKFSTYSALYHGGPFFETKDSCQILGYYIKNIKKPAIIMKKYGKGKVFVSGVHFEYNVDNFQKLLPYMAKNHKYMELVQEFKKEENNCRKLFNLLMEKIK